MRRLSSYLGLFLGIFLIGMLIAPPHVEAIVYGFVDTNQSYSNTGAFIVKDSDGQIFPLCSGTLIAHDVFLTASHCTLYFTNELEPRGFTAFISFDSPIPFGSLTVGTTNLIPVTQVVSNPNYNQSQSDPGDIAVLIVPAVDTASITPAALPTFHLLDQLAKSNGLRNSVFTAVGYGVQNRVVGGGVPFFQDTNPVPRMYAFESFAALNKGYLRLSQNPATGNGGACFGDSGGPNFLTVEGAPLIAAITITGDSVCRATNVAYRLDTSSARVFLAPYVSLP
jgi:Trypsin.